MRGYACCYGQGRKGARTFRREITHAATPEEFMRAVVAAEELFEEGAAPKEVTEGEEEAAEGNVAPKE